MNPTAKQIEQYLAEMRASLSRAFQFERAGDDKRSRAFERSACVQLSNAIRLQA